uniref:Uncharacterized protein n=1 Tax=Anguilla anguilla TaxID=7936 RepID=A0A0E9VH51_ANGAN
MRGVRKMYDQLRKRCAGCGVFIAYILMDD